MGLEMYAHRLGQVGAESKARFVCDLTSHERGLLVAAGVVQLDIDGYFPSEGQFIGLDAGLAADALGIRLHPQESVLLFG